MGGATRDVTPIHETARELYSYLSKNKLNNLYHFFRSENKYKAKDREKFKCNEYDDDLTQRPDDASDIEESEDKCPEDVNILLTAPTGKAANLLGKRADLSSCTLHQVIWSYRMLKPGMLFL